MGTCNLYHSIVDERSCRSELKERELEIRDVPCYECVCVPICRKKPFNNMLNQCSKICYFYYNEPHNDRQHSYDMRIHYLKKALKGPVWAERLEDIQRRIEIKDF